MNSAENHEAEILGLRRALLRLVRAFQGQHPELDRALEPLSHAGVDGSRHVNLAQAIDDVVAVAARLDTDRVRPGIRATAIRNGFEAFLAAAAASRNEELARLLAETRTRLQGARGEPQLLELIEETARQLCRIADGDGAASSVRDCEPARSVLLELLRHLDLPAGLHAKADALRAFLQQPQAPDHIHKAAQGIAVLLKHARTAATAETDRLSEFLRQVGERIELLQRQLLAANSSHSESVRQSDTLDLSMAAHLEEIQSSIDTADTLDDLKTSVTDNLRLISNDVSSYVETERQRNVQAEKLFCTLTAQLRALEGESQKLREGMAQERARATTDPLTGIPNRQAFDAEASREYSRWRRKRGALSVIVLDLDRFKEINDSYGHLAGDRVLQRVAEQLRAQIRQSDFLARYGGEEFVILLPGTPLESAQPLGEKLRARIEKSLFHYQEQSVAVTISVGVAGFKDNDTPDDVFERADKALYLAKHRGRNRVCSEGDIAPLGP